MSAVDPRTGQVVYIPGIYSDTEVVSDLAGVVPTFQVAMVLADAEQGYPYNVLDNRWDHETIGWHSLRGSASSAKTWFGQDSDMGVAMAGAKRHGLPAAYCVCMSPLVRASVIATSTGPVNEATIGARRYGWPGNHIKVKVTAGPTLEVTPVKHFSRLTADAASGATRIYVRDNTWAAPNKSITIGDNDSTNEVLVVSKVGVELDSNGQDLFWVEFTSGTAAAYTTAQYAGIVEYDENNKEAPAAFTTTQAMIDWIQKSSHELEAKKEATFSAAALLTVSSATALKDITAWGTVTNGTSPSSGVADYNAFITDQDESQWDAFAEETQKYPRGFLAVSSASTVHGALRDWAVTKRNEGYPIAAVVGCGWGDVVVGAGDDTDPKYRAGVLNSQDVQLVAGGLDRRGAHISTAPAVFGLRMGAPIPHNLTGDDLFYSEVEVRWDERSSGDLTALLRAGVTTYRLSNGQTIRWRVARGLSTLADNAVAWNTATADTALIMQRDLADYVDRIIRTELEATQVGADRVDAASIGAVIARKGEKLLVRRGLVTSFTITSILKNATGTGYDVKWRVTLPVTTDFITMTTTIYLGEE